MFKRLINDHLYKFVVYTLEERLDRFFVDEFV